MNNGNKWLVSPIGIESLKQFPFDAYYDKCRAPSEVGYLSYQTAWRSACSIFS